LDHLFAKRTESQCILLFFSSASRPGSVKAEVILRSLIRQCLHPETLPKSVEDKLIDSGKTFWSSASLSELLTEVVSRLSCVHVVLDGLDELEASERRLLVANLKALTSSGQGLGPVRLFLSTRPSLMTEIQTELPDCHSTRMDSMSTRSDLESFTHDIVLERHRLGDLAVSDEALLEDVVAALIDGAQGM
jgi:hypothetical protein